jgi:hypothetical protein
MLGTPGHEVSMQLCFFGATQTVTGSRYLLTCGERRVLVHCGSITAAFCRCWSRTIQGTDLRDECDPGVVQHSLARQRAPAGGAGAVRQSPRLLEEFPHGVVRARPLLVRRAPASSREQLSGVPDVGTSSRATTLRSSVRSMRGCPSGRWPRRNMDVSSATHCAASVSCKSR